MSRLLVIALALVSFFWQPQNPPASRTANTIGLPADAERPKATLTAVSWLAGGAWRGDGMGGIAEEQWSAPAGGQMMGMFRQLKPGTGGSEAVSFYEFLTLVEREGSLVLKLKHFNPDLTGWEDKEKFVTFRLARVTPDAVYFDGLTFRRDAPNQLSIFLALRDSKTGELSEATFRLTRR